MPLPQGRVKFNKDTISKLAKKEEAAEGYFAFRIMAAEPHEPSKADNYDIMSKLSLRMLKDPDDMDSITGKPVSTWITWPLTNPDDDEHEPPRWAADQACALLHALDPKAYTDVPRFVDKKLVFKGEEIDREEEEACREEAIASISEACVACYEDHAQLVGHRIFARLYYPKKSPNFPSLVRMSAEAEEELDTVYVRYSSGGGEKKKSNGATGKAKAARGRKGSRSARRKRVN